MKIYNSLTRTKEEFVPLKAGKAGIYVCGPTVYDEPHIGHGRSAYIFDVIRRYFVYRGYKVTFVRNVTDVDDKIIEKARTMNDERVSAEALAKAGRTMNDLRTAVEEVSKKYLNAYHEDMALLGIGAPDKEPKATEYIPKMIKFISLLVKNGAAYPADGDVYFDIKKADNYGKLSNQNLEKMESGAHPVRSMASNGTRVSPGERKKDPLDFALWKKAKENEPAWESPWGGGRPGWHIECSAMSSDILGSEFDIHGGGIDLIFPHHENEIAQSEAAGKKFARYWMHNGLLTIKGEKMAKSLGNFISIKDFLARHKDPDYLKLLFLNTHYRHPVDYTDEKIQEMKAQKERIVILAEKLNRVDSSQLTVDRKKSMNDERRTMNASVFRQQFENAMDDDFNMPSALAAIFDLVSETNRRIDGNDLAFARAAKALLAELTGVFGLSIEVGADAAADGEIARLIERRDAARKTKDFAEADKLRKALDSKGIVLEDTKEGTVWRRKL